MQALVSARARLMRSSDQSVLGSPKREIPEEGAQIPDPVIMLVSTCRFRAQSS